MKNVKRMAVLALMCCCVFAFTSCQKDGVYKPKKKISEISLNENGHGAKVVEKWNWSGNLLSKIDYVEDGYSANFEYNGKQVSKITMTSGEYVAFSYDGKLLQTAVINDGEEDIATFTYTHEGKLISAIEGNISTDFGDKTARLVQLVNRFVTPTIENQQNQLMLKSKGRYTTTQTFTYDGKNIVKSVYSTNLGYTAETNYTYCDYLNPFYHFNDIMQMVEFGTSNMSQNALVTSTTTNNIISTQTDIVEVAYPTVDGKYPTQATYTYTTKQTVGGFDNNYANGVDDYYYVYE